MPLDSPAFGSKTIQWGNLLGQAVKIIVCPIFIKEIACLKRQTINSATKLSLLIIFKIRLILKQIIFLLIVWSFLL
jgi:hypothetical protein